MKDLLFISMFLIFGILIGCSTTEESTKKTEENKTRVVKKFVNDVNLEIDKNVSWVNLMPGAEPKFHVSGMISLLDGDNYNNKTTELKFIKIYQSGEELYFLMPKVIEDSEEGTKNLTYSTIKGLSINKNLDTKKPVMIEYIFKDGKDELKYRVNNLMVEEVH